MAREFEDFGFWLPSGFLTDDDLLPDFESDRPSLPKSVGFNSDLTEMATSPAGLESEDDLDSDFTHKLALSTSWNSDFSSYDTSKGWKLSSSPQSTLCGCKHGSPNSVSPPDAEDYLRRDHLYQEMARMRIIEQTASFYSSKLSAPQAKLIPIPAGGVYQSQSCISAELLQAPKRTQQQLQMNKKGMYGARWRVAEFEGRRNCGDGRGEGLSMAAWAGPKMKRRGTGVFLPRRFSADDWKRSEKVGHIDGESIDNHLQDHRHSYFHYGKDAKHREDVAENRSNRWGWTCQISKF